MQQGDCNAPTTMMRAMNFLFKNIKDVMIHLDDILIANHTYEGHITTTRAVMTIAIDNKLLFNRNRCPFMPVRIQILGNILTDQGLEADPDKIDSIYKFHTLGKKRRLQSFLGMANYVRQIYSQLGSVVAPLSELQGATKDWQWTHLHDICFEKVRTLSMSDKVLNPINSDPSPRIYVICDSADTRIAGWMAQKDDDGLIRPARFPSSKNRDSQMNYKVSRK